MRQQNKCHHGLAAVLGVHQLDKLLSAWCCVRDSTRRPYVLNDVYQQNTGTNMHI